MLTPLSLHYNLNGPSPGRALNVFSMCAVEVSFPVNIYSSDFCFSAQNFSAQLPHHGFFYAVSNVHYNCKCKSHSM